MDLMQTMVHQRELDAKMTTSRRAHTPRHAEALFTVFYAVQQSLIEVGPVRLG